jgi:hypothetical protein
VITGLIIAGTVLVFIGAPVVLMRALTSERGQRFLRWCLHWDDSDHEEPRQ